MTITEKKALAHKLIDEADDLLIDLFLALAGKYNEHEAGWDEQSLDEALREGEQSGTYGTFNNATELFEQLKKDREI